MIERFSSKSVCKNLRVRPRVSRRKKEGEGDWLKNTGAAFTFTPPFQHKSHPSFDIQRVSISIRFCVVFVISIQNALLCNTMIQVNSRLPTKLNLILPLTNLCWDEVDPHRLKQFIVIWKKLVGVYKFILYLCGWKCLRCPKSYNQGQTLRLHVEEVHHINII